MTAQLAHSPGECLATKTDLNAFESRIVGRLTFITALDIALGFLIVKFV